MSVGTGPLLIGNFNKRSYDRTRWYAFRDHQVQRRLQTEPLYFKVADAVAYGMTEAVILLNLAYWIGKNRQNQPNYQFHRLSPTTLAEHLPYTVSTLKRALKHLTDDNTRVLLVRRGVGGHGALEYAFADESRLQGDEMTESGSGPNLDRPQMSRGSDLNMAGSNLDMASSNLNMGGPILDMGGPNLDNNTILIDTPLKDTSLEDRKLLDRKFQSALVPATNSLPAENKPNQSPRKDSPRNTFPESVARLIRLESVSTPVTKVPASAVNDSLRDQESSVLDSVSLDCHPFQKAHYVTRSESTPVKVISDKNTIGFTESSASSSAQLPASVVDPVSSSSRSASSNPSLEFLDPVVDENNMILINELIKFQKDPQNSFIKITENALESVKDVIASADVDLLRDFSMMPDQKTQDAALTAWATPLLESSYAQRYGQRNQNEQNAVKLSFMFASLRLLSMGYYRLMFSRHDYYIGQRYVYAVCMALFSRIKVDDEKREEQERKKNMQQRIAEYGSPDRFKENDAHLSAPEKMRVFEQSLQARNRIGVYDKFGNFHQQVVQYTQPGMQSVREFFQLNSQMTVAHLNVVLDRCLDLPPEVFEKETDPLWHARNGHKVALFIQNVATIASQLNLLDQLPAINSLPPRTATYPAHS